VVVADTGSPDELLPSGSDSVWSSDDVPSRDQPLDIVWERVRSDPDQQISLSRVVSSIGDSESGLGEGADGRSPRSKLLIGGAVLVGLAAVVAVVVQNGGDDGSTAP